MFIFTNPLARMVFDGDAGGGQSGAGQGSGSGQGAAGTATGSGSGDSGSGQSGAGQGAGTGSGQGQGAGNGGGDSHSESVPYDRFAEVNEQRQAAERDAAELRRQLTERERSGMPELDRARADAQDAVARAEAAERERDELRASQTHRERADWVRNAARDLTITRDGRQERITFHDVEDAVARINVDELRSEQGAQREVAELAARAEHLTRPFQAQQQGPAGNGGDLLQRVLEGGQRVSGDGNGQGNGSQEVIPAERLDAMTADQLVSLQETDPELYARSLRAAEAAQ